MNGLLSRSTDCVFMAFYDSYDYWNIDDDWFVAGYAVQGRTAAQFKPTRTAIIRAIQTSYHGGSALTTKELMSEEGSWHKRRGDFA